MKFGHELSVPKLRVLPIAFGTVLLSRHHIEPLQPVAKTSMRKTYPCGWWGSSNRHIHIAYLLRLDVFGLPVGVD